MNLHEYQGKEILNSFGVRIQKGIVASTPEEAVEAEDELITLGERLGSAGRGRAPMRSAGKWSNVYSATQRFFGPLQHLSGGDFQQIQRQSSSHPKVWSFLPVP